MGVHWQVRDSGDQRDVAAEVMAVDPGPYCREVLCGHQQIAGQGPDDRQDGPLPPAVLGRDVQQFPDVMETFDRDPDAVGDEPPPLVGIVGDVPACFDTRSSSAFSCGMAAARRIFSPTFFS